MGASQISSPPNEAIIGHGNQIHEQGKRICLFHSNTK